MPEAYQFPWDASWNTIITSSLFTCNIPFISSVGLKVLFQHNMYCILDSADYEQFDMEIKFGKKN